MPIAPLGPALRDEVARVLAGIAAEAGDVLLRYWKATCEAALKGDGSPVSEADMAAEALIRARLLAAYPYWPIVSEERAESHVVPVHGTFLIVDPLDGTRPFLAGKPDFCVLIGLIEKGVPIAGAIHAPVCGRSWWAGAHAFTTAGRDFGTATRIAPSPPRARIAIVSRDEAGEKSRPLCASLGASEILAENSALKFARLADGEADLYPRNGRTMQWDIAAGDAVLRALGGGVFDLERRPLVYGAGPLGWANPDFVAFRCAPARD